MGNFFITEDGEYIPFRHITGVCPPRKVKWSKQPAGGQGVGSSGVVWKVDVRVGLNKLTSPEFSSQEEADYLFNSVLERVG